MCNIIGYENQLPGGGVDVGWICTLTGLPAAPTPSGNGVYCNKFCNFAEDQKQFHEERDKVQKDLKQKGLL
jgi:hypothetical protein